MSTRHLSPRRDSSCTYNSNLICIALAWILATRPSRAAVADIVKPYTSVPSAFSIHPDYYHQVTIESSASPLQYLAQYKLGDDGTFKIALDIVLTIAIPEADEGRDMLYLLACNVDATHAFLNLSSSDDGSNTHVPSYCAMANRTLGYYCHSFPLQDESPDKYVYQSYEVVSGSMADMAPSPYAQKSSGDEQDSSLIADTANTVLFFIDSCETLGGQKAILRSCLKYPPGHEVSGVNTQGLSDEAPCFFCPNNYPVSYSTQMSSIATSEGCKVPPFLPPTIKGTVSMNLCNAHGECLGKMTSAKSKTLYGLSSLIWCTAAFIWAVHICAAARGAVVELQNKMKLIPVTRAFHSLLVFGSLYVEHDLVGANRRLLENIIAIAQLVAIAVFAEVVVVIAKGWKITRPTLPLREIQWVRFVSLSWAWAFTMLKNAGEKQLAVIIVGGLSWTSVVFMVWHNSAFNLNMLKHQLAIVRQLDLDPQLTPVYTKYMLFRRFRALLAMYVFGSCVFGTVTLLSHVEHHSSEWVHFVGGEGFTMLLFTALGYNFRCRRFGRLLQFSINAADANYAGPMSLATPRRGSILPEATSLKHVDPRKSSKMIVVLNPDQSPWLATTLEPEQQAVNSETPNSDISS